jgi:arylamine N-acetyltransferase
MNNSKLFRYSNEIPIVLYNADKQEMIGIFLTSATAMRYIYEMNKCGNTSNICSALKYKTKIRNSRFDFPIAVRYANDEHKITLDNKNYKIMYDYPLPRDTKINGYDSSRSILQKQFNERNQRRWIEQKNKRESELILTP